MNNGGPAFPEIETDMQTERGADFPRTYSTGGMSRRDYFAAKAMQGLIAADSDNGRFRDEATAHRIAHFSVMVADALIAKLSKG